MGSQERICGLCLKICDNYKAVEGYMKDVLERVLPKINLTAVHELVMCKCCTEMLIKCFHFKNACVYNYNNIVPSVTKDKLHIKVIYLSKNGSGTGIVEDQVICVFCMSPVKSCSAMTPDADGRDVILAKMIEQCLPELDLSFIEKPVVCSLCCGSLENCFRFVTNCLIVEEKIKKYCETLDISNRGQIKLSGLLQSTTNEVNGNSVDIIKEETQLCEENENGDEIRIEIAEDIFKSEPMFYADSEFATEEDSNILDRIKTEEKFCGEKRTCVKEENLFEMEDQKFLVNEEIEIKTDEHDFNRIEDGVALPHPKVTTKLCSSSEWLTSNLEGGLSKSHVKYTLTNKHVHKVRMNYRCDCCSFQTKNRYDLKIHLIVHMDPSEVTMHKCDSCSFQTRHKKSLKTHLLTHKDLPEVTRVFKCDSCSFQTRHKNSLRAHLLKHKGPLKVIMYKCDSCPYQVKDKVSLKRHLLKHKELSEVTMYKCESCPYQTIHTYLLKKHLVRHEDPSKITIYKCDSCSYQTRYKANIKTHVLRHKKKLQR